jgi:DNA-binding transcriptional regulator YiaG
MAFKRKKKPMNLEWPPERIKSVRKAFDESQAEFATRMRVSVDAIRFWEQGRGSPTGSAQALLERLEEDAVAMAAKNGSKNGKKKATA